MTYSRSDCARMLGISMDTLRYYEEIGIVKPRRTEASSRRVYTEQDILVLLGFRKTKSLGYSNSEIAAVFSGESDERSIDFVRSVGRIKDEIERLQQMAHYLSGIGGSVYDRLKEEAGIIRIGERAERDFILFTPENEEWIARAMEGLPYINIGYWISRRCLTGEEPWNIRYGVDIRPLERINPELYRTLYQSGYLHSNGDGMKAYTYQVCRSMEDLTRESFEPMMAYARAHRFEPQGDIFGGILTRNSFIRFPGEEFIVSKTIQINE